MTTCPQAGKCKHWCLDVWPRNEHCTRGWTLEADKVQESKCPDFKEVKQEDR